MSAARSWPGPVASLDRVARLRVLAAGLPGTAVAETVFDAPMADVWPRIADLERSVPVFDQDVRRLHVRSRRGEPGGAETLRVVSHQTWRALWLSTGFDVDLSPGWCWMVSRPQTYVVGMAAEPVDGHRTRFALLEGFALAPERPALRRLLGPVHAASRWRHRRHEAVLDRLLLDAGVLPPGPFEIEYRLLSFVELFHAAQTKPRGGGPGGFLGT